MRFLGLQTTNAPVLVLRHIIEDGALSCKAKGLYVLIMAYPVGEQLTLTRLMRWTSDRRDGLEVALKELIDGGYLVRTVDGWRIGENPQLLRKRFREIPEKAPRQVTTAPSTATSADNGAHIREIPESPSMRVREIPENTPSKPFGKFPKTPGTFSGNSRKRKTERVPRRSSIIHTGALTVEELHEDNTTTQRDLFNGPTDEERAKTGKMRKTPMFQLLVFRHKFKDLLVAGVDIEHYYRAILNWSDRHPRKTHDFDGWVAVIEGAMERDKNQGKLRMIGQTAEKNELSLDYLKMGR